MITNNNKKTVFFWTDQGGGSRPPFHYKTTASFYASPPWIRLKNYKLAESPLCEKCEERGLIVPAAEVHHIREISLAPDLALDFNNLESLCKTCHSQESYKFIRERNDPGRRGGVVNIKSQILNNAKNK